jgi:hypothetical protein
MILQRYRSDISDYLNLSLLIRSRNANFYLIGTRCGALSQPTVEIRCKRHWMKLQNEFPKVIHDWIAVDSIEELHIDKLKSSLLQLARHRVRILFI